MPIVFIHGVANRETDPGYASSWRRIEAFLREHAAPAISEAPNHVPIKAAYWGDLGSSPAWGGTSRPRGPVLGMGPDGVPDPASRALVAAELWAALDRLPQPDVPAAPGPVLTTRPAVGPSRARVLRLRDLTPEQLSDLAVALSDGLPQEEGDDQQRIRRALAADAATHDPRTRERLAAAPDLDAELDVLGTAIEQRAGTGGVIGMGSPGWLRTFAQRLGEVARRADNAPGFIASRVLAEGRGPINDSVARFIGDVFVYFNGRGRDASQPGPIPRRVLSVIDEALAERRADDEPLVVLSHSMGGQIMYDLVTHFLPGLPAERRVRIDFWCAAASQVGLFEELKLFCASSDQFGRGEGNRVPFPDRSHLGEWWNVWDYNDFLSYTVQDIIEGVDDGPYSSGLSILGAHSGYLQFPSFFRLLAGKLRTARDVGWWRP
jgi:hypothetical protein